MGYNDKVTVLLFSNERNQSSSRVRYIVIEGPYAKHDGNGNGNVTEQEVYWAKQWLCTCILIFGTFHCRSPQNSNVK